MTDTTTTHSNTRKAPVIAIMGHIDHGKSTLLDYIRKTNIVSGEAGGITQHISAYEVQHTTADGIESSITFLDTPGHEAFSAIRSRGATVADIAILIVSAEDGVKPQTLEALKCIKEENIPYIVAINKIDKPGANIERTKNNLMENEIYIEGYGGTIPAIPISAKTGEGVPDLLDMMLLVAEMEDLTGDREALATGTIIESNMDPKKGISATLIIKDGTLHKGSYIVSDDAYSPVRIMENFLGESIDEATFSSPVQIIGWNKLPKVGKMFIAVEDKKTAEAQALKCKYNDCEVKNMMPQDTGKKVVPIIIRTDSAGSSEAVASEVNKILCDDRICTHILYTDIGAVSETDVKTALSNEDTVILAFHTKIDPKAEQLADRMNVEIQSFDIIYKLTEWLTEALEKRKPTSHVDKVTGGCKVLKIFSQNKKDKQVIGAKITEGILKNKSTVKIMRKDECVATGTIKEMQQQKMDVDQVAEGEFGMLVDAKTLIETGDTIVNFISVEE